MGRIKNILKFLSLLDRGGSLSLTNLSLVLLVGKILVIPSPDLAAVVPLILAFASYMHKRSASAKHDNDQVTKQLNEQKAIVEDMVNKFDGVKDKLAALNLEKLVRR